MTFEGSGQFLVRGTFDRGDLKEVAGRRAMELLQLSLCNDSLKGLMPSLAHRLALTDDIARAAAVAKGHFV